MIKIKLLVALLLVCFSVPAWAKHLHEECYYRDIWCAEHGGKTEVVMEDGTCCDCLTEEMVVEVVFARDAYEGIFQALQCSTVALRPGGLLIIVEELGDWEYVRWANIVISFYQLPVAVFVIEPPLEP